MKIVLLLLVLALATQSCAPAPTAFQSQLHAGIPGVSYQTNAEALMDALEEIAPRIPSPVAPGGKLGPFELSNRDINAIFFKASVLQENSGPSGGSDVDTSGLEEEYLLYFSVFEGQDRVDLTLQIAGLDDGTVQQVFKAFQKELNLKFKLL